MDKRIIGSEHTCSGGPCSAEWNCSLIRLVIVGESELLRLGLQAAIETGGDIEVVADFEPSGETVSEVSRLSPDVVLVSMEWPAWDSLFVCREIREQTPSTKVVMLSSAGREEGMVASMIAGASGYVSTGTSRAELVCAVRVAASGGAYFDRGAVDRVLRRLRELMEGAPRRSPTLLTEREKTILAMVAEGSSNREIGRHLNVATSTVRNNITVIMSKLELDSRAKLIAYAIRYGLVDDPGEDTSVPGAAS